MTLKPYTLSKAALLALCASAASTNVLAYTQDNLVSDIPGLAANTDSHLVNPWGISRSASSPFWVSNGGTGTTTLYNTSGTPISIVVTLPAPASNIPGTPSKPTGQVFNGSSGFLLGATAGTASVFLFATEDGTISGWNPSVNSTNAIIKIDNSANGEIYKGLAINTAQDSLFAANFAGTGGLEVFGSTFNNLGSFTDNTLPAGYAPFNAQNINGTLYVSFAKQLGNGDDDPGAGNGFVDTFDPTSHSFTRVISNGALNSPWGMAIAPADFGQFSNSLLVGNFGDGKINAFNPADGSYLGTLSDDNGNAIVNSGLWGLMFGNGGNGGVTNKLYFTAGLNGETHGLFGSISATTPVPLPAAAWLFGSALLGVFGLSRKA